MIRAGPVPSPGGVFRAACSFGPRRIEQTECRNTPWVRVWGSVDLQPHEVFLQIDFGFTL